MNIEPTLIARKNHTVAGQQVRLHPVRDVKAKQKAGIALLQKTGHETEVLLVQQANGRWSLPKGKRKTGESIKQTGLRECREETGCEVQTLRFVGWGVNSRKHIRFYLWKSEAHRLTCNHTGRWCPPKSEIRRLAWVSLVRAQQMLKPWQAILLAKIVHSISNKAA